MFFWDRHYIFLNLHFSGCKVGHTWCDFNTGNSIRSINYGGRLWKEASARAKRMPGRNRWIIHGGKWFLVPELTRLNELIQRVSNAGIDLFVGAARCERHKIFKGVAGMCFSVKILRKGQWRKQWRVFYITTISLIYLLHQLYDDILLKIKCVFKVIHRSSFPYILLSGVDEYPTYNNLCNISTNNFYSTQVIAHFQTSTHVSKRAIKRIEIAPRDVVINLQ